MHPTKARPEDVVATIALAAVRNGDSRQQSMARPSCLILGRCMLRQPPTYRGLPGSCKPGIVPCLLAQRDLASAAVPTEPNGEDYA
jgi:hypothetical protein